MVRAVALQHEHRRENPVKIGQKVMKRMWGLGLICVLVAGCSSSGDVPENNANAADMALAKAIMDGNVSQVSAALDANPELVNAPNAVGETPLHYAARAGDAAMIRLLLDRGASIAARNDSEETPVELALNSGASEEVLQLLQGNAPAAQ